MAPVLDNDSYYKPSRQSLQRRCSFIIPIIAGRRVSKFITDVIQSNLLLQGAAEVIGHTCKLPNGRTECSQCSSKAFNSLQPYKAHLNSAWGHATHFLLPLRKGMLLQKYVILMFMAKLTKGEAQCCIGCREVPPDRCPSSFLLRRHGKDGRKSAAPVPSL